MENEELKKINKELKIIINEATFISIKCRNKIIKILGEEFSVNLPLENFKSIDITITDKGNIIMRDEEYQAQESLSFEEIQKRYSCFFARCEVILRKKEINYYNLNDKKNIINLLILLVLFIIFLIFLIFAVKSFLVGDYFNCIWLFIFMSSWLMPGIKERVIQGINFIKRKLKK